MAEQQTNEGRKGRKEGGRGRREDKNEPRESGI